MSHLVRTMKDLAGDSTMKVRSESYSESNSFTKQRDRGISRFRMKMSFAKGTDCPYSNLSLNNQK